MRGVARMGDRTSGTCSVHGQQNGVIVTASADNIADNGMGVARVGDLVQADCGHQASIITGDSTHKVNDKTVARLGSIVQGDLYTATVTTASTKNIVND